MSKKILIAYYSWSGATKRLAQKLHDLAPNSELWEIKVPEETFSSDMYETSDIAKKQEADYIQPAILGPLPNFSDYQAVLVGGPVWSGGPATPVWSLLTKLRGYSGIVAPFYTDAGGFSEYETRFGHEAGGLKVHEGLEMNQPIEPWLDSIIK